MVVYIIFSHKTGKVEKTERRFVIGINPDMKRDSSTEIQESDLGFAIDKTYEN